MTASSGRRSLLAGLLLAAAYVAVGLVFAELGGGPASPSRVVLWRRLAWVVSALAFAAHIAYEHVRLENPPLETALHAGLAAAGGACGLAVAANLHGWSTSNWQRSLAVAIVAWPLLTFVPAFVAALAAAVMLRRLRRRS